MINLEVVGTEADVCQDIAKRQQVGIKKYGVTVSENPLTRKQWLQHAYEEALDHAVYLKRAIEEECKLEKELSAYKDWAEYAIRQYHTDTGRDLQSAAC